MVGRGCEELAMSRGRRHGTPAPWLISRKILLVTDGRRVRLGGKRHVRLREASARPVGRRPGSVRVARSRIHNTRRRRQHKEQKRFSESVSKRLKFVLSMATC